MAHLNVDKYATHGAVGSALLLHNANPTEKVAFQMLVFTFRGRNTFFSIFTVINGTSCEVFITLLKWSPKVLVASLQPLNKLQGPNIWQSGSTKFQKVPKSPDGVHIIGNFVVH